MAAVVKVRKRAGLPRQRPVTTNDVTNVVYDVTDSDDDDEKEPTDLHLLKEVSQRLNLATRRPSTVQWKQVIEFRKSMGLYSSDVEPEFLDKIVEAKLKNEARNSPKNRQKSSLLDGDADSKIQDDVNNNTKNKTTKENKTTWRKKKDTAENVTKKNGFSLSGLRHKKSKLSSKKEKNHSTEKSSEVSFNEQTLTAVNSLCEIIPTTTNTTTENHCDVTIDKSDGGKFIDDNAHISRFPLYDTDDENDDTTGMSEMAIRYRNVTRALGKIRRDLITMRIEDNKLARTLLDARSEINIIRVHQSCDAHAVMLDDVTYELEEEDLLPALIKACDLPSRPPGALISAFSPLRNIGLSRMNLNGRRFSIR